MRPNASEEAEPSRILEHWENLSTLADGSPLQKKTHFIVIELGLQNILRPFSPLLVGDIALGLNSSEATLKVICQAGDLTAL